MSVSRYYVERLDKSSVTADGALRVDAVLSRVGVFSYTDASGKTIREYRPPEEVTKADSVASLRDLAVTVGHPPSRIVDPSTWRQSAIGHQSGEPRTDAGTILSQVVISDGAAIGKIKRGELIEISPGYRCRVDATPGVTPEGERYDAVQRDIVYNHIAILPRGQARQGSTVALRLDSIGNEIPPEIPAETGTPMQIKIRVDGRDHEVEAGSLEHVQLQTRADAARDAEIAALKAANDKLAGERDALTAQTKSLQTKLDSAPAEALAAVKARVELESKAAPILGAEYKFDGKSDNDIRVAAILKQDPSFRADGKSADYLAARFDFGLKSAPTVSSTIAAALEGATVHTDSSEVRVDAEASRIRNVEKSAQLWQQPLAYSRQNKVQS